MLVVEAIAGIRRKHFIEGKTIKEIARDLKVSRNTVRKMLRSERPHWSTNVLFRMRHTAFNSSCVLFSGAAAGPNLNDLSAGPR
jgi:predicted transcriptional regulator